MSLFEIITELDKNEEIHLARILVLLNQYGSGGRMIEGMTKLAKMDFLLRYPVYLEKAVQAKGKAAKDVKVQEFERSSVESKMVRYKYGPWDFRYRRFINILIGRGLAFYSMDGKTVNIGLTENGIALANNIMVEPTFSDISRRAKIVYNQFDNTGSYLKDFIYRTFPEIGSLEMRSEIE